MQSNVDLIPKTVYMDKELIAEIDKMADDKMWKFSPMAYVLLQFAVKEKNRKKKSAAEDHS